MSQRVSLVSYLADVNITPIIQKGLMGKAYAILAQILFAEQRIFEMSMLLGYRYRNKLDTFAKLFSASGKESSVIDYLASLAKERIDKLSKKPEGFLDVFFEPELKRLGLDKFRDMEMMERKKIPTDDFMQSVQMASTHGIAFGVTYPNLVEELWNITYGTPPDVETWRQARQSGLDIPETPEQPISLEDGIKNVMPAFELYIDKFRPEMRRLLL